MTKTEQRQMRRLEIRIEELEKALTEATRRGTSDFREMFEVQYHARAAVEAIQEGLDLLREVQKNV